MKNKVGINKILLLFGVMFIGLLCLSCVVFTVWLFARMGKNAAPKTVLNYGWDVVVNSERYSGIDLRTFTFRNIRKGDRITLNCILPENMSDDSTILVHLHYTDVIVYIDGEEIFREDTARYATGQPLGNGFYTVMPGPGSGGRKLSIVMRAGEDNAFSSIDSPEIWRASTFRQDYAADRIWYLALAFFFIVVGCSMALTTVALEFRRTYSPIDIFRLGNLALFAIALGIWIMGEMDLTEIFMEDIILKSEIKYFAFYLIPVFFVGYHFENDKSDRIATRNVIFGMAWVACALFFLLNLHQHMINGQSLRAHLSVSHALDAVTLILVVGTRIIDLKKGQGRRRISTYATLFTGIAAMIDLVRFNYLYYFSPNGGAGFSMNTIYVVMIFFVLSLFFDYMSGAINDAREEERLGIISKLAFTDPLTGFYNRQSAENYYDEVDYSGSRYVLVQFDLNYLKKANDTYGHDQGDRYIVQFAETLKLVFEGKGYMARTGGDEFVLVMLPEEDGDRQWLDGKLRDLNAILSGRDTGHSGLTMSTAYGVYDSKEGTAASVRDGLRIADNRMYEMKKEMKAGR